MRQPILKMILFLGIFLLLDRVGASVMKTGLERYFGLDRPAEVLCVGHSRAALGIDREILEQNLNCQVAKYTIQGTNLNDHLAMIRQFLDRYPDTVRVVVYVVDDYTFGKGLGVNQYRLLYPFMDEPAISSHLSDDKTLAAQLLTRQLVRLLRYNDTTVQNTARMGFMGRTEMAPEQSASRSALIKKLASIKTDGQQRVLTGNIKQLKQIIQLVRSRNTELVLLYHPFVDLLPEFSDKSCKQPIELFREMAAEDPGVHLLYASGMHPDHYAHFCDATHPNRTGQIMITEGLADSLNSILNNPSNKMTRRGQ